MGAEMMRGHVPGHLNTAAAATTLLVALSVAGGLGCAPMSTFQSPVVLAAEERAIGVGALQVLWDPEENPDDTGLFPSIWYRSSVTEKTDLGVKVGLFEGVVFDIKHSLVEGPVAVAGDLGVGLVGFENATALVIRPAVLVGTPNIYAGAWYNYPLSGEYWDHMSGFVVGASIGSRRILMLEYNWFKEPGGRDPSMSFGLAVQGFLGERAGS
jgi:hypothetical protein